MRVAMLAALAWPCLPIATRPGRTSSGHVSLRPLQLRLRGGGWQPTQVDGELLSALAASERGANSITSECFFENPGPHRRSLNPGMLEALRDFADMPMCNQSLCAFDRRVSLRALLVIVSGSADGSPVEPVGVQALAARCLHKLCITVQTTEELAGLCRSRKVALDELVAVLKRPLQHEDPQIKWHLLDTMALLARDVPGTALLQKHNAVPTVLRCLWDEDTDVVLRTGKVLANLAAVQAGLGALFASESLQILMKALDDNQAHVRSVRPAQTHVSHAVCLMSASHRLSMDDCLSLSPGPCTPRSSVPMSFTGTLKCAAACQTASHGSASTRVCGRAASQGLLRGSWHRPHDREGAALGPGLGSAQCS